KLMAEQKKVKEKIDKLNEQYAALSEKLAKAEPAPQQGDKSKNDPKTDKQGQEKAGPKLTAEELKKLAELQKELAALAGSEERNAAEAKQLNDDLKKSIEQAKASKQLELPQTLFDQMDATQRAFDRMVANALRDLAKDLKDDSDPKKGKPDVKDLKDK